jgi:hypothetical protein
MNCRAYLFDPLPPSAALPLEGGESAIPDGLSPFEGDSASASERRGSGNELRSRPWS